MIMFLCIVHWLSWYGFLLNWDSVPSNIDLNVWLLEWLTCDDRLVGQIFCTTLWKIWSARNKAVFENKAFDPVVVAVAAALEFVMEFSQGSSSVAGLSTESPNLIWSPPDVNSLKINVDAGCFNTGCVGWGLVIRNHLGEVLFAACKKESQEITPVLAEALGIRWSLQIAKEQRLKNVIVESDAEVVVKCINQKSFLAAIEPIIHDCRELWNQIEGSSITFVKRQLNIAAHVMAKLANQFGSKTWVGNAPTQLLPVICNDTGSMQ